MLNRRALLTRSAQLLAGSTFAHGFQAAAWLEPAPSPERSGRLPANFIGLGYEMSSVATPGLLSASNSAYVNLVRALGAEGVIRVGGIVADYTRYAEFGALTAEPKNTVITREALEEFQGFLGAVGWQAIWSLNFAQGTVEEAVLEARAVNAVLGPRLLAFELGNEVENYARGDKPFRAAPYTYEQYRSEYTNWRSRILQAVPAAQFAAPDTAASVDWVELMAADAKHDVQLLTTHYYRGGQKQGTADQLLHSDPRLSSMVERLRAASARSGIPWRICETNSFFGGGRPGVSDTFTGTLWTLSFLLYLAANGCSGVNIETGVNQLGFLSSYSPVRQDEKGRTRAGAPYFGMLAFATAAHRCTEISSLKLQGLANETPGYLLGANGVRRSAVILNIEQQERRVNIAPLSLRGATLLRLLAPGLDSVKGITFAGGVVEEDGRWTAKDAGPVEGDRLVMPRTSAAILLASR